MRYRHLMKDLLLSLRLMFKASGMKLEPGSSQRCTVAGAEAMDEAAYRERLSRWKEKMFLSRVTQKQNKCPEVPWDSHSQRPCKFHDTRP